MPKNPVVVEESVTPKHLQNLLDDVYQILVAGSSEGDEDPEDSIDAALEKLEPYVSADVLDAEDEIDDEDGEEEDGDED